MKIALGSDHGGFDLKSAIKEHLQTLGHEVIDFGTDSHESCDYPLIAEPAARAVASGECDRGILVCGTGIGIGIAANKVPGIRAGALPRYLLLPAPAATTTTPTSSPWASALSAKGWHWTSSMCGWRANLTAAVTNAV